MRERLSHIGCFQIEEALGRGAFKTVYRAINRDAAKNGYPERVALCIPHMQDEESRRLLQNEYRIVNALSHPSIVRIYGVEEIEGSFFAVMELVEGETVASLLKRQGALPLEEAIMITERVADALDYAHEALAFHRDIKPANIMILKDKGEKGSPGVKVLDFGLARLMSHSQYVATTRVGSVAYMAPEQFEGAAGMNADIWALGATFFQMITNTLPFVARDEATLVRRILYESPDLDVLQANQFEPRLIGVMRRVLEKDPEKRFRKAGDFVAELQAVARHAGAVSPLEGKIEILLRAHFPLIFIHSHEEERVLISLERIRQAMSAAQPINLFVWSETGGLRDHHGRVAAPNTYGDPVNALQCVIGLPHPGIFIFLDMHPHLAPVSIRLIRDAIWTVKRQRKSLVFLSPVLSLPAELEADATLVSFSPPDMDMLQKLITRLHKEGDGERVEMDGALREGIARALVGLTYREAERVLRRTMINHGGLNEGCVTEVVRQKQQIVRAAGVLEFCEPNVCFDDIGGLENLKLWFQSRRKAFTPEGARFGLRNPRGAVLVGVPGCGKSLSSKALAREWGVPLLRLDMGRIRGSRLGESEARIRQALQTAELASPCVLWIDELEKAFAGLGNSLDSGVGERVFGTFLSWLEEKTKPVFVVATANDITRLPPEFMRKGRFDEIFFVGLPDDRERKAIWKVHLRRPKRLDADIRSEDLVELSRGHTGAEIAEAVISAMYYAFSDNGRLVKQHDIEKALKEYVPLSFSPSPMISSLMAWGQENARAASI